MMNHCTTRCSIQCVGWLAFWLLSFIACSAWGDIAYSIDQGQRNGQATLQQGTDTLVFTDEQGQSQTFKLIDLDEVRFNVTRQTDQQETLLIDNDAGNGTRQKQAKIKLRKGLHRITLPYWQIGGTHRLKLSVAGPRRRAQVELGIDHLRCFRNEKDQAKPSAGQDEQGYRLPELTHKAASDRKRMLKRARYRLYAAEATAPPYSIRSLADMRLERSGSTSTINTGLLTSRTENLGIVFDAFFKADQDGEYHFTLLSDDGAQLYFGKADNFTSESLNEPPIHTPWIAELAYDGQALGELKTISEETLTFHLPLVGDMTVALSHTHALWDRQVKRQAISRANEPSDQDTVYLRDKKDPSVIRSISGKINALDDASLLFEFRGKARTISRSRVVGMVFKHASRPTPTDLGMHQTILLQGGQKLPGKVQSLDDHLTFQIIGGGVLTAPRPVLKAMRIEGGRRIDLTRTKPNAEEVIPYFGLKMPYKINTNFAGQPIVLFDGQTYDRGIAVHSKSRLHYKLKPNCERFQATFGLMAPNGKLGNVQARVLGDNQVLWQQDNITQATDPINIDVPLKGVQRLILEVDFGKGQGVGDRAAWTNPRLIYASSEKDQS